MKPKIALNQEAWLKARRELLAREKQLTALNDEVTVQRQAMPWIQVSKDYRFETEEGEKCLADLFAGKSQLVMYHFMFAPEWEMGCKACAFWVDPFDRMIPHLGARDIQLIAVSRAPLDKLRQIAERMNWQHPWVSSNGSEFNHDFGVTLCEEALAAGTAKYNYGPAEGAHEERPGVSVFARDEKGSVFHTYSCYARGLDQLNAAYRFIDLTPKGRDEANLPFPMAWLELRDEYDRNV